MPDSVATGRRLLICLLMLLCACDLFTSKQPPNPCQKAKDAILAAYSRACEGRTETCCFCRCFNDGKQEYDREQYRADGTCRCLPGRQERSCLCQDDRLAAAEKCLQDREACQAQAAEFIGGQAGVCTLTPL